MNDRLSWRLIMFVNFLSMFGCNRNGFLISLLRYNFFLSFHIFNACILLCFLYGFLLVIRYSMSDRPGAPCYY
jgi:hypothetical protein